jgi:uncharacterized metal-binding protein
LGRRKTMISQLAFLLALGSISSIAQYVLAPTEHTKLMSFYTAIGERSNPGFLFFLLTAISLDSLIHSVSDHVVCAIRHEPSMRHVASQH